MSTNKKKCFVIMPFSKTTEYHSDEYWKKHFELFLKPLIERNQNLEAFRSEPLRGNIANQIITDLVNTDIVVADLTDHNSNVFWELGVRQSFKHCSVTIAEMKTEIPFHFSHKGILFYDGEHLDNSEFEEKFLTSLQNCLDCPKDPDSPVLETLGGRGTLYNIMHKEENERKVIALLSECRRNLNLLKQVKNHCIENRQIRLESEKKRIEQPKEKTDESKIVMSSSLYRTSAAEFLYINRYLDRDQKFYNLIDDYQSNLSAANVFLEKWSGNSKHSEDWLTKNNPRAFSLSRKLINALKKNNIK